MPDAGAPTVVNVYEYLKQVPPTADNTTLLTSCLQRAEGIVNAYMRLKLKLAWTGWGDFPVAAPIVVYAAGSDVLYLRPHQIGSVTLVQQSGITVNSQAWYEDPFSGDLYMVAQNPWFSADRRYPGYASWGRGPYMVTAAYGYGPTPPEVAQVILELAVNIWRGRDRGMWSEQINGTGGSYLKYTGGLTKQQEMILESIAALYKVGHGTLEIQVENPRFRTDYRGEY